MVDEAFIDFVEEESVKQLIRENPYLIILRSLTKYYALPGLRLGYLLAHLEQSHNSPLIWSPGPSTVRPRRSR